MAVYTCTDGHGWKPRTIQGIRLYYLLSHQRLDRPLAPPLRMMLRNLVTVKLASSAALSPSWTPIHSHSANRLNAIDSATTSDTSEVKVKLGMPTGQQQQSMRYVLLVSTKVSPPSLTRICTSGTIPTAFSDTGADQGSRSAISTDGDRIRYSDTAWESDSSTGTRIGVLSFVHMLVHPRANRTRDTPTHSSRGGTSSCRHAQSQAQGRCCVRTTKFTAFQNGQPFADPQTFGPQ
eukprot:COSAG02_NODE_1561_length_11924_cov_12.099281_4_plen_235_part_00